MNKRRSTNKTRNFVGTPLERHPDAGVRSDARLQEADRILVVAVEQVVDASEEREMRVEVEARGEIDRGVARSIEARDGEVAVAIDPGADREDIETQQPGARRLPLRENSALVLRAAQQLLLRDVIGRFGV